MKEQAPEARAALRSARKGGIANTWPEPLTVSATLIDVERFETPEKGTYRGAWYFEVNSIRVFDPIGPEVVAGVWPEFKGFSHVKWKLDPEGLAQFERKLTGVERPKR